jgi:hypothetical protein
MTALVIFQSSLLPFRQSGIFWLHLLHLSTDLSQLEFVVAPRVD